MIEEEAVVARVEAGRIWVEKVRRPLCGACEQPCASAVMGAVTGDERKIRLTVLSSIPLEPGNRVIIGIREEVLVTGALAIYLLPLVGLFAGAILGKSIGLVWVPGATNAAAIVGALLGLMITLAVSRVFFGTAWGGSQPVVLRKLG